MTTLTVGQAQPKAVPKTVAKVEPRPSPPAAVNPNPARPAEAADKPVALNSANLSSANLSVRPTGRASVKNVLRTAFSQVGNPYRPGGVKPETGFDCSGFVKWVYGQYGVKLPHSSGDMMAAAGQSVSRQELKPGDVVFFGRKKRVTHVGIYTGGNKYIHSPSSGKWVQESSLDDRSRGEYYVGARRILKPDGPHQTISEEQKSAWVEQASRQFALAKAGTNLSKAKATKPLQVAAAAPKAGADKPLPVAAANKARTHKIDAGDTLSGLARKYGVTSVALTQANHLTSDVLRPGKTLIIPAAAAKTAVAANKAAAPAPAQKSGPETRHHKVASGDTLYDLARKYGVSPEALAKANNLGAQKMAALKLGQNLVIPPRTKSN
jgi:cell wall-associated NlpC family hydrolase/LysM repeat protein